MISTRSSISTASSLSSGYGEAVSVNREARLNDYLVILLRNKGLIALVTTFTLVLAGLWVAMQKPSYQARATLLLEKDEVAGGVLSELASLSANPAAESEIALLTSRSLATVTASQAEVWLPDESVFHMTEPDFDPFALTDGLAQAQGNPSAMERLGLDLKVERHDLRPLAGIIRRLSGAPILEHRLYAQMEPVDDYAGDRPGLLGVSFFESEGSTRVEVGVEGSLTGSLSQSQVLDYLPGMELEYQGWRLRLHAAGSYLGQTYALSRRSSEQAVLDLMNSVQAVESGRKTNVVYVFASASDPSRAAETANALCKNYIRRNVGIGRQKATQTVRFIDAQLQEQIDALAEAERRVVALQTEHPETIALSVSAEALIEQISTIELARTQEELALRVIREALEFLDVDDYEGLARLGVQTPNLLALSYIKELGQLEAESLRLERSDVAGYKQLLAAERLRLSGLIEVARGEERRLLSGFQALEAGDASGIAQIGGTDGDGAFSEYLTEIAKLDAELSRLHSTTTASNPSLTTVQDARRELGQRLAEQVGGALAGVRTSIGGYQDLIDTYTQSLESWPAQERETIDKAIKTLRERVRASLSAQAHGLEDSIAASGDSRSVIEERLSALPASELALAESMRERVARSKIVEFLLTSQQEAAITAAATSAAAVLIDPAVPPRARKFPRVVPVLGLAGFLGLLIGCGFALLYSSYRGSLYSEAEIERVSGLSVLGSIPDYLRGATRIKEAREGKRFLPMRDAPESAQAESYRQIRASVRLAMAGEDALRTLGVTSCVPKEGKTVTNADLAMAFGSAGRRVLLVDCDLRRPQVHRIFDVPRSPGFGEALERRDDWRAGIHPTGVDGVHILPAGRCEASPGELLASDKALPVIDELLEDYDLVVFDLPPAVVVADVANFAGKLDAVLLLYRSGGVSGTLLASAVSRLRRAGVNLMGLIVNAVYVPRSSSGYGYGYGYGSSYSYQPYGTSDDSED